MKMPSIGQADIRPYQNAEMVARNPKYAEIVCHCERILSRRIDGCNECHDSATTLDGLRRRTRASQGRCQGFNCHAALLQTLEARRMASRWGIEDKEEKYVQATAPALQSCDVLIIGAGPRGLSTAVG